MNSQCCRVSLFAGGIASITRVLSRVSVRGRRDAQNTGPAANFHGAHAHRVGNFLAVEVPKDRHRQVSLSHVTEQLHVLSGEYLFIERKWIDPRRFCQ